MVAVPSALYLAAGLLAVAASVGLAVALLSGRGDGGRLPVVGATGALVYAVGHALAGAQAGPVEVWTWLHVAGLVGIAVGSTRMRPEGLTGLPLLVPVVPPVPAYAAAAAGSLAALRIAAGGRTAFPAAAGIAVMALGHGIAPVAAPASAVATVVGALLVGVWLWQISSRRILAKLLTAFVSALLAMAILLAAVLSTVSSAELTAEELQRLDRLAEQIAQDIGTWPAQAVMAAAPLSRSVGPLVDSQLSEEDAADLFTLSLATQDFFLTVDTDGRLINSHPADLPGSLRLAVAGAPLVSELRAGTPTDTAGGLLASGEVIVAIGAVAVRSADTRPEDPPAGVLVTGRLIDAVWAARQAAALDVGLVGVVGGQAVFATEAVAVDPEAVVEGLAGRSQADLGVGDAALFAASATLDDPQQGGPLGRIITISTPEVIAAVERAQAQRVFVVALLGAALAVVVAVLVTRRFVRPIGRLTAVAESVALGDLTDRVGLDSPDEVGRLGSAFDEMIESLAEQQADLTVSAQREARLRGRLQSLTDSMGDGLVAVDTDGLIITFNPAAQQLTGQRADDVLGAPLEAVLVTRSLQDGLEDQDDVLTVDDDPLRLNDPVDADSTAARLRLQRQDGATVPVAVTAAPVRSPNGDVIGRVYVLRDITRDLQVERMKTEFLANVSHELRTPITPIKGYANVLARREVGPEAAKQFAGEILSSTRRLERVVEMIVDFAGLDSGRVILRRDPVDLHELVGEVLQRWREDHEDRIFANRLNGALPPIAGDPAYLRRCLDEVLDNAVKFSPDGEPVVVTATARGNLVDLQVIDEGVGIDTVAGDLLFTDFVQIDGTETRHFGGLGLGLGMVKRILDGVGATAHVDSEPGRGTTFTMTFPAAGPVPVPPLPDPPSPPGSVPPPPP